MTNVTPDGQRFLEKWKRDYPETPPINHRFKANLSKRWMRIHSLPDGKRGPDNTMEWDIVLARQNEVIDYLVPQNAGIIWVWNWIDPECHIFKSFDLIGLGTLPDDDVEAEPVEGWILTEHWESGQFDPFLMMIAGDQMRAFIIAPDCLISPYCGGIDVILKDPHTAHAFKRHFADWASQRQDGL